MNRKLLSLLLLMAMLLSLPCFTSAEEPVTVQFWQYSYDTKVALMDELIAEYCAEHPNVTIEHCVFPYDSYWQKLAAALTTMENSGVGPNIINFHNGKFLDFIRQGVIIPFPEDVISAEQIETEYCELVQNLCQYDGTYYYLPMGVRDYALFYNKALLEAGGYTVEDLKGISWERLYEIAEDLTQWNGDELLVEGITMEKTGRLPHRFIIHMSQLGGTTTTPDYKTATLNSPEALQALNTLIDAYKVKKVGVTGFCTIDYTAFNTGKAALHIDGSFRAATFNGQDLDFEWGVVELPSVNGSNKNIGDLWGNAVTRYTTGAELEASKDFLKWLYSDENMERWTFETYEIGSKNSMLTNEKIKEDPILSVFLEGMGTALSPLDIQDYQYTDYFCDIFDLAIGGDMDPAEALETVNRKYQNVLDDFWYEFE